MLKRRSNIPGFQEGGANVDPVSGNDVPIGSLPEEVRDDIDAKLSPGEFVIPADVVRFIGLERLMKMRDEAKKGLQRMSDIGQMGNAEEVGEESNSTYEDEGFESEIDDILSEIEAEEQGRDVNEQTEVMMAQGGFMKSGTDLTKAPKNPVFDVRYYKNAEGSVMYITHINGKPMTPIPEGYKPVSQEEAQKVGQKAEEAAKAETPKLKTDESGDADTTLNKEVDKFLTAETPAERDARMGRVSNVIEKVIQMATPLGAAQRAMSFLKGPQRTDEQAKQIPIEQRTGVAAQDIRAQDAAATAYQTAINSGMDAEYASQAARGAAQGVNSGMSPEDAAKVAVEAVQDVIDREGVPVGGVPSTASSSRSMTGAGSSFAVSPTTSATTTGVAASGSGPVSRNLDGPDPGIDRSGSYDYGGSSYGVDSGFGTGNSFGNEDLGSFLAKGGLVNKRQYPSKKKRGKGIAAAKT